MICKAFSNFEIIKFLQMGDIEKLALVSQYFYQQYKSYYKYFYKTEFFISQLPEDILKYIQYKASIYKLYFDTYGIDYTSDRNKELLRLTTGSVIIYTLKSQWSEIQKCIAPYTNAKLELNCAELTDIYGDLGC